MTGVNANPPPVGLRVPLTAAQRRRNRQGDQVATWLIVGIWVCIVLQPSISYALRTDFHLAGEVLIVCVTIASAAVVVRWLDDLIAAGLGRVLVMVVPSVYVTFRNLYSGVIDFHGVTVIVVTLAIAAAKPRGSVVRIVGPLMAITAVAAILLGFFRPDLAISQNDAGEMTVRDEKEVFPGLGLLIGMFPHENPMGQVLALSLPFLLLIERRWVRFSMMGVIGFALLWTSARGSLFTAALLLVLMVVLPRIRLRRLRTWIERLTFAGAVLLCAGLPWILRPPDEGFSDRGQIWRAATQEWWNSDYRLFGLGVNWFTDVGEESSSRLIASAVTGHNQIVHLAVTGGLTLLVLALLQTGFFAWATTRTYSRYDVLATLVITGMWINGCLEISFGYVDDVLLWPVTFPVLAALLFCRDAGRPPRVAPRRRTARGSRVPASSVPSGLPPAEDQV